MSIGEFFIIFFVIVFLGVGIYGARKVYLWNKKDLAKMKKRNEDRMKKK